MGAAGPGAKKAVGPWAKGPLFGLCVGGKWHPVVIPYAGQWAEFYFS